MFLQRRGLSALLSAAAFILLSACLTAASTPATASPDALFRAYRHAVPANIFSRMEADCRAISAYEDSQPALKDGKRVTRWMPLGATPRTAIEEAILHLSRLAKVDPKKLVGFEWWIQNIGAGGPLGFHVDKDESVASNEHYLLHPLWSSVFYITQAGGGTLITNQFSPQGSGYEPVQATEAAWSFPSPNKFLLFNGTLLHGVVPSAVSGSVPPSPDAKRITFLVNFWHVRPKEPNCKLLRHEDVPNLRLLNAQELQQLREEEATTPSAKPRRQPLTPIDLAPGSSHPASPFRIDLPGGAVQHVQLPSFDSPPAGQTFVLHYTRRKKVTATAAPTTATAGTTQKQKQPPAREAEEADDDEEEEESEEEVKKPSPPKHLTKDERAARRAERRKRARGEETAPAPRTSTPPAAKTPVRAAAPDPVAAPVEDDDDEDVSAASQRPRSAKQLEEDARKARRAARRAGKPLPPMPQDDGQAARPAAAASRPVWPPPPPAPVERVGTAAQRLDAARAAKDAIREHWEL